MGGDEYSESYRMLLDSELGPIVAVMLDHDNPFPGQVSRISTAIYVQCGAVRGFFAVGEFAVRKKKVSFG